MDIKIEKSWKQVLKQEFEKDYFHKLVDFVKSEYKNYQIFPKGKDIFNAFSQCPFEDVRVVIIGQDPYHGENQAHGLCFSVSEDVKIPPSLKNIFKEIKNDIGKEIPKSGNLERWKGVLMLNSILTVRKSKASSHKNIGWEVFTDAVIKIISEKKENIVFLLWGAYARKKGEIINKEKHLVLESVHPSPFSAYSGFFGNKHFSKTNDFLKCKNLSTINW
ncbi:MAG: uracil-DNA glycosylase [Bacteroidetes bacterium 4572_128]|nr:MAG: uracil-DNA glycosylase [Bacteroidetes bacterium 4572_128]